MQGLAVLRQIEAKICSQAGASSLAELSSQFYTFIPHVSGMSAPPTIRDLATVASKVDLLMCLLNVTVAVRKMEASEQAVVHPLDHVFSSMRCSIQPLQSGPILDLLQKYLVMRRLLMFVVFAIVRHARRQTSSHGPTHQEWKLEIHTAFAISRSEEESRFEPHEHDSNRRLLWCCPVLFAVKHVNALCSPPHPKQARQPHLQCKTAASFCTFMFCEAQRVRASCL